MIRTLILLVATVVPLITTFAAETADSLRMAALTELKQRAADGDAKALYDMGYLHDTGYMEIPVDSTVSTDYYRRSAELGYAPAQNYLGFRYYRGEGGVKRDPEMAVRLIEKAAQQGDPKGFNNLGWLLMEGEGIRHDYKKAAYWLNRAAEAGLPVAMSQLADLYRSGRGVETDTARATTLYESALARGLADAEKKLLAMNASRYSALNAKDAVTEGLRMNAMGASTIAAELFASAACDGDPQAMALLANAFSRGEGVDYDHDTAVALFYNAAKSGNPSAQFVVGELLEILPDALMPVESNNKDGIKLPELGEYAELPDSIPENEKIPDYWYSLARNAGITDAGSATRALLTPP